MWCVREQDYQMKRPRMCVVQQEMDKVLLLTIELVRRDQLYLPVGSNL